LKKGVHLLRPGSVLIADNVLWDELEEFRKAICRHKKLESAIIPVEDGLSISIKAQSPKDIIVQK